MKNKIGNSVNSTLAIHPSFGEASVNNRKEFVLDLPLIGKVKVDFYSLGKFAYHFGLHGAVSSSGYKSNFLHPDQLVGYESPEQVAEVLAKEHYELEGKQYQKQLRVKVLENTQLRIF